MRPALVPLARSLKGNQTLISWSMASRDGRRAGPRHGPTGSMEKPGPLVMQCYTQEGGSWGVQGEVRAQGTESPLSNPCLCFLFFFCDGFMSSSVGSFRISDSLTAN